MSTDLESLRIDRSLKGTQPGRRRWIWLALLAATLGVGAVAVGIRGDAIEVDAVSAKPAEPGAPGQENVVLCATGYVIAAHKIELAPKVMGRVAWVGVERADKVQRNQPLVRLEDDEYRARVMQAQGQLDAAKARLEELEHGARPEEIARSEADLNQARAELDNARARLERLRAIADAKAVAIQDLEDAQYRYASMAARQAALQASLDLIRKGPRAEQIAAQKALVMQADGQLLQAQSDLANTVIKAPISGTILARNVEVGEYVTTGYVGEGGAKGFVVSLADLNELRVELDISQEDFAKISPEQKCWVTTDAYPDCKYDGVMDLISPEANRQKATVQVRVRILQPDQLLRPEMNASVTFCAGPQSAAAASWPVVPISAVRDGAVFVVANGKISRRAVQTGSVHSQGVEIRKGLTAGELVVATPPEALKDGMDVRVRK